jgi:hypothetical protein
MIMLSRVRWAAGVTAALLAATPAAVVANKQTFEDPAGNVSASVDIHRVTVVNGTPSHHRVKIVIQQRELRPGDAIDVWIDTDRAHRGPEFRASAKANTDAFGLVTVHGWTARGHAVDAPRFVVHSNGTAGVDRTTFLIPRHAIDRAGSIRVAARVQRQAGHGWVRDWAPRRHTFYGWVAATT